MGETTIHVRRLPTGNGSWDIHICRGGDVIFVKAEYEPDMDFEYIAFDLLVKYGNKTKIS